MGWGTTYKYEGYLSRITKSQIESRKEECIRNIDAIWDVISMYAASRPPVTIKDDGIDHPYPEWLSRRMAELREELEENLYLLHQITDCQEAMRDDPDSVMED